MTRISRLHAHEILDSRGNPTVEVSCTLESGAWAHASVPSGASTGTHEAHELRDNDKKRYNGLGVLRATEHVNTEILEMVKDKSFDQRTLDEALIALDGTPNKSRLGANAILGVSLAFARATARDKKIELYEHLGSLAHNSVFSLPQPAFNIINGGKHADSGLDIQEFMIIPTGFDSVREKIRAGSEIVTLLKHILRKKGYGTGVGDEGGFAPHLSSNEEAFDLFLEAITGAGYSPQQVQLGIDVAASSLYENGSYELAIKGSKGRLSSDELIAWYSTLVETYPIISIEDGFAEDDWESFARLQKTLGDKITIVGDDLTVTNTNRITTAAEKKAINSVLIKPNQIGTLSETIDAILATKAQGWSPFVSHRSGETTDTFIADLAVGLSCDFIKSGSTTRGERVCKHNRLMEIEHSLPHA